MRGHLPPVRGAISPLTRGQYAPNVPIVMNLHATIIREIGGRTYLAGLLGLPVETVKSWPKRGIPARYWHRILKLAESKRPELTYEELDRTKPAPTVEQTEPREAA